MSGTQRNTPILSKFHILLRKITKVSFTSESFLERLKLGVANLIKIRKGRLRRLTLMHAFILRKHMMNLRVNGLIKGLKKCLHMKIGTTSITCLERVIVRIRLNNLKKEKNHCLKRLAENQTILLMIIILIKDKLCNQSTRTITSFILILAKDQLILDQNHH